MIATSQLLLYLISSVSETSTSGSEPETAGSLPAEQISYILIGTGSLVLAGWILRILSKKDTLDLSTTPGRYNSLHPLIIIAVFLIWQIVCGVATVLLLKHMMEDQAPQLGHISGTLIGIVLSLVISRHLFKHGITRGLGLSTRHWIYDSLRGMLGYLAIYPVCWVTSLLSLWAFTYLDSNFKPNVHSTLNAILDTSLGWKCLIIFSATVLTPIYEEILFRGLLQSMLRRYITPWLAILISSIIFGMAHFKNPEHVLPLIIFGIALGYHYERTGRLWASILMHAVFNLIAIICFMI